MKNTVIFLSIWRECILFKMFDWHEIALWSSRWWIYPLLCNMIASRLAKSSQTISNNLDLFYLPNENSSVL